MPLCRISTRALSEAQEKIEAEGAKIVAIMPDREHFAASFKLDADLRYPVLTDIDNGYTLCSIWRSVGAELDSYVGRGPRPRPSPGNQLVHAHPGDLRGRRRRRVSTRFIDPDYRRRMTVEDLAPALKNARNSIENPMLDPMRDRRYHRESQMRMNAARTAPDS